jgi:hypothetical protein
MSPAEVILLVNAATTWFMCGVIWFVQLVHYPLFRDYDRGRFTAVMLAHQRRTAVVVFPAMAAGLVTSLLLVAFSPPGIPGWMPWIGAVSATVWGVSTARIQVPLHEKLAALGFSPTVHTRLVTTNWVRAAAWSVQGLVCVGMLSLKSAN